MNVAIVTRSALATSALRSVNSRSSSLIICSMALRISPATVRPAPLRVFSGAVVKSVPRVKSMLARNCSILVSISARKDSARAACVGLSLVRLCTWATAVRSRVTALK